MKPTKLLPLCLLLPVISLKHKYFLLLIQKLDICGWGSQENPSNYRVSTYSRSQPTPCQVVSTQTPFPYPFQYQKLPVRWVLYLANMFSRCRVTQVQGDFLQHCLEIAKDWKSKYLSERGLLNKLWSVHRTEYQTAIKTNKEALQVWYGPISKIHCQPKIARCRQLH